MNFNDVILCIHEYRFLLMSIMFFSYVGFTIWAFPKIEKGIIKKNKLIEEKDDTLSGCWDAKNLASARIHTWPPDA